jgi:hypothetical protein
MRLDPAKKADYFAYLSENKSTKNNATSYKEDLVQESERRHKSSRVRDVRNNKSSKHVNNGLVQDNKNDIRHESENKHRRHRSHRHHHHSHRHHNSSHHNRSSNDRDNA